MRLLVNEWLPVVPSVRHLAEIWLASQLEAWRQPVKGFSAGAANDFFFHEFSSL
jgi:hypothetical protein